MTREDLINQYFLNLPLQKEHIDIYYVRTSILKYIRSKLHLFNGRLLDVGCGIMPYREIILKEGANVASYTGLDFESALDEEYALGKPDLFWKGDVIPLESNSVDTILATEFFEHSPSPEAVMLEMKRVLKPGGLLFFTVPFLWNLHLVPYDEYRYTPFSLNRHLQNSGFDNIDLTPLGGWDASLAQMLGIWMQRRPMTERKRKWLSKFIIPIMQKLISYDTKFDKKQLFQDGGMITGIGGIAYSK